MQPAQATALDEAIGIAQVVCNQVVCNQALRYGMNQPRGR